MKLTHSKLLTLAGTIWLLVGAYLFPLGLNYLTDASEMAGGQGMLAQYPLLKLLGGMTHDPRLSSYILMALGIVLGFAKGRFALGKAANRTLERLKGVEDPAPLTALFNVRYVGLIVVMMLVGMSLSIFGLAWDIRGFVDMAVGSGLINGAMVYFRHAADRSKEAEAC